MARDLRDDVIRAFADSEGELFERVVGLQSERDSYRLRAVQAIHYAHDLNIETERPTRQLHRIREEYPAYRSQMITGESRAA